MQRTFTCWSCIHCTDTDGYKAKRNLCELTKRWGNLTRGYYCDKFEYRQRHNEVGENGIIVKNRQSLDYRTKNQWLEVGRVINSDAVGKEMYACRMSKQTYVYYLIDDTHEESK